MNAPRNRDYFTQPVQTSRSAHDYGHTGRIEPMAYAGVLLSANLGKTLGTLALGALLIGLFWVGMVICG